MNELSLLDSFFGNRGFCFPQTGAAYMPNVDVAETKDAYVLSVDLPGRTQDDVDLSLKEGVLTISSVKETSKEEKKEENQNWLLKERTYSQFKRSFTLPKDINEENVNATFKNGVLTVTIARREAPAEKKIAITAA